MITFEKARKIVYREGRSLSDLFRDFLRDYVQRHEPGNPQMPIDRFLKEPEKQPEANVNPEDLRLMHQVIDHLEKGYDLSPKAAGQHRLLASKYLGKAEAAQRLMELLDHL